MSTRISLAVQRLGHFTCNAQGKGSILVEELTPHTLWHGPSNQLVKATRFAYIAQGPILNILFQKRIHLHQGRFSSSCIPQLVENLTSPDSFHVFLPSVSENLTFKWYVVVEFLFVAGK